MTSPTTPDTGAGATSPRRALFGIARDEYALLRDELEQQRTARIEAEARDRAREGRLDAVLADAAGVARRLPDVVEALTRSVTAEELDADTLTSSLAALLGPRVRGVEARHVDELPGELAGAVGQRHDGVVTVGRRDTDDDPTPLLLATAARAGETAIVVYWSDGVHDDGPLRAIVEDLCRAAAASLAVRALARDGARRHPVTLLGGDVDAGRLAALREAQGQPLERVEVALAPAADKTYSGLFGEPAWDGERFHLAQALDRDARALGGEAFELAAGFACLVPPTAVEQMRERASAQLERSVVEATVREP